MIRNSENNFIKITLMRAKTFIKNVLFCFVYYSGILHLYIILVFKRKKRFPVVIINYHNFVKSLKRVINTEPTVTHRISDFKKEVRFLKRYFDLISLDEAVEKLKTGRKFKRPAIVITIDDGFKDNFELFFPVASKYGIPATIFLTAGLVGTDKRIWVDRVAEALLHTKETVFKPNGMLKSREYCLVNLRGRRQAHEDIIPQLKEMTIKDRDSCIAEIEDRLGKPEIKAPLMLSWQHVMVMKENGISFGAHTRTHPILTKMHLEEAKCEISESKRIIETKTGGEVKHFAYPNGRPQDFNEELREFCKEIGFESVCTCDFGGNKHSSDIYSLKRVGSYVPISVFAVNLVRSFLRK